MFDSTTRRQVSDATSGKRRHDGGDEPIYIMIGRNVCDLEPVPASDIGCGRTDRDGHCRCVDPDGLRPGNGRRSARERDGISTECGAALDDRRGPKNGPVRGDDIDVVAESGDPVGERRLRSVGLREHDVTATGRHRRNEVGGRLAVGDDVDRSPGERRQQGSRARPDCGESEVGVTRCLSTDCSRTVTRGDDQPRRSAKARHRGVERASAIGGRLDRDQRDVDHVCAETSQQRVEPTHLIAGGGDMASCQRARRHHRVCRLRPD